MMDLPWEKIITVYGPLGLGWPMFIAMFVYHVKSVTAIADRVTEAMINGARVQEKMTTLISERIPRAGP